MRVRGLKESPTEREENETIWPIKVFPYVCIKLYQKCHFSFSYGKGIETEFG
jgi:hypothetical protein